MGSTSPDILAAVVAYLQQAMGPALGVTPANPAVWSDWTPDVPYPFAVVEVDPAESYTYQSNDPETGHWTELISDGQLMVSFVATSKAQVKVLANQCLRVLIDTVANLYPADGRVIEMRPTRAMTTIITDTGAGVPAVFKRSVIVRYRQQFMI